MPWCWTRSTSALLNAIVIGKDRFATRARFMGIFVDPVSNSKQW